MSLTTGVAVSTPWELSGWWMCEGKSCSRLSHSSEPGVRYWALPWGYRNERHSFWDPIKTEYAGPFGPFLESRRWKGKSVSLRWLGCGEGQLSSLPSSRLLAHQVGLAPNSPVTCYLSNRLKVYIGLFKCHRLPVPQKSLKLFFLISDRLGRFLFFLSWVLGRCPLLSSSDELSAWDHFIIELPCTLWYDGSLNHLCYPWQSTQERARASDWQFESRLCRLFPG